ncbi:MAG TPA: carbohydrate ABC transporter permease [Nakamurella sp.]|jgi:alpha-glucoside transport system permease protein|nr:carbohydrate ABC transporter permease [Nakamurella sp.]
MSQSGNAVELTITDDLPPEERLTSRQLKKQLRLQEAKTKLSSPWASGIAIVLAILWTIPTFGLFVTSFRLPADIATTGWWTVFSNPGFTFENYQNAWSGSGGLSQFFLNSFVIVFPAVIIPISLALLAAYAFAWIDFKGRDFLFVAVFALQIVPIQVALIPLQTIYVNFGLQNSFWPVWISHTIFGLPLAIFLLHNFMKEVPRSIVEAARVDGAGHVKIFFVVLLPLLVPAIAAFGIFQFLWVWNDLLVALVFAPSPNLKPVTAAIAQLSGTLGNQWQLLSAGAFISMVVPLVVFVSLQRYFVRGLLAGGVKG